VVCFDIPRELPQFPAVRTNCRAPINSTNDPDAAIAKDFAPPEVRAKLGHYPELGKLAAQRIPKATLVERPDLGHAPQMQDPEAFHQALLKGLAGLQGAH
jgi:pimeloyl-ACP methyl ester carboxylesterase